MTDAEDYRTLARRRTRVPPAVTPEALARWWDDIGAYACVACWGPPAHADHIQPLARGGEHSVYNLLPLCSRCNLAKSDRDPWEWLRADVLAPPGQGEFSHW